MNQALFISYDDTELGKNLEEKNKILGEMLESERLDGDDATKEAVKRKMSGVYSLIHVHAHGVDVSGMVPQCFFFKKKKENEHGH